MPYQLGPAGGPLGQLFNDGTHGSIRQISVGHGDYVDVIQATFEDGTILTHGGRDGDSPPATDVFALAENEYLVAIDGRITSNDGDGGPYIKNIRFTTSLGRQSPIWGGDVSDPNIANYHFGPAFGHQIVGFVGCDGKYVDDIGVLLDSIPGSPGGATAPVAYGASGGIGGQEFWGRNAEPPLAIKEIQIRHGSNIDLLRVIWNDGLVENFGGNGGDGPDVFTLDDDEWLTGIDGGRRWPEDGDFVKYIRFTTNKRTSPYYGPTGGFSGHPFSYQAPPGFRIFGFWGRHGNFLDAIGVYMA